MTEEFETTPQSTQEVDPLVDPVLEINKAVYLAMKAGIHPVQIMREVRAAIFLTKQGCTPRKPTEEGAYAKDALTSSRVPPEISAMALKVKLIKEGLEE